MAALGLGCPNLTELEIRLPFREILTAVGLRALTNATFHANIESLIFHYSGIEDGAFKYLSRFPRLQKLWLVQQWAFESVLSPEQLKRCLSPSLKWLSLNALRDADLAIIGELSLQ